MKKKTKVIIVGCICAALIIGVISCIMRFAGGYRGEQPELYSVGIYLPAMDGYRIGFHMAVPPLVKSIETDDYGRTLFCYAEMTGTTLWDSISTRGYNNSKVTVKLVICQKSDKEYSYFYEDINYIESPLAEDNRIDSSEDITDPFNGVSEENIEKLKLQNDWNKPIDENKCIKVKKTREPKYRGEFKEYTKHERMIQNIFAAKYHYRPIFLMADDYGRLLYYMSAKKEDDTIVQLIIMINSDGTYDPETYVLELDETRSDGIFTYAQQIREFKQINHWRVERQV